MLFSHLINSLKKNGFLIKNYELASNPEIVSGSSIEKAIYNNLTFLEKGSYLTNEITKTNAGAILLPNEEELINIIKRKKISWAILEDPRLAFAESLNFLTPKEQKQIGVHPTAVIGKGVILGKEISIGPNVSIGSECKIGDQTTIHAGVVIYENVQIGKNNVLHGNCVIHRRSIIEDDCIIHSNAVIGSEGFGFVPTKQGWKKMPQTGVVIIEENVEVGCNTNIDRPSVGETRVGAGTKIDNLVQIGHGVTIGKRCALASQVGIAGGAKLGDGVILAGQSGIANRVSVGDQVIASSRCGITKDIEAGQVISGFPAIPNKLWLRCTASFKRLPEIAKTIRNLNNQESE